jgi:hypothetical protein
MPWCSVYTRLRCYATGFACVLLVEVRATSCIESLTFNLLICNFSNYYCITNKQLAQLPQYAVGPMINVHPFITHVYIAVPDAAVRGAMDTILCTSAALDFVRDNDIYTDWKVTIICTTITDFIMLETSILQCTAKYRSTCSTCTFDSSFIRVNASACTHTQYPQEANPTN